MTAVMTSGKRVKFVRSNSWVYSFVTACVFFYFSTSGSTQVTTVRAHCVEMYFKRHLKRLSVLNYMRVNEIKSPFEYL